MDWFEITIYTSDAGLDAVCGRLDMLGITDVMIGQGRASIEAYLNTTAKYWDFADMDKLAIGDTPCVKAYIHADDTDMVDTIRSSFEQLKGLDTGLDLGSLDVSVHRAADEDWANNWKAYYKPIKTGERLIVCPSWEKVQPDGRAVLLIDPGMAFGTGSHHTTRMCLELLEQYAPDCDELLDIGCGSGILSIAGLLLGAKRATGVDIDPAVQKIAAENAAINGIYDKQYCIMTGDVLADTKLEQTLGERHYGVICANIVASVIIQLMGLFSKLLKKDGVVIASGIIDDRLDEVKAAFVASGFEIIQVRRSEDWAAILVKMADVG
ncbi:MAG: 50S ribosomal protein L11 methyltransferase [Clostridia bacterium]